MLHVSLSHTYLLQSNLSRYATLDCFTGIGLVSYLATKRELSLFLEARSLLLLLLWSLRTNSFIIAVVVCAFFPVAHQVTQLDETTKDTVWTRSRCRFQ